MRLSGRNIRRIYSDGTSAMAFDLDMEITNLTGEASFGISGIQLGGSSDTPKSTLFNFKSGRVFDPNGKNVYSYQRNNPINIKGTFESYVYDYIIDDNLISTVGPKPAYIIQKIFLMLNIILIFWSMVKEGC